MPSETVGAAPQGRESDRHPSDPQPAQTQGKQMDANGDRVSVRQSEEFEVRLAATPTTGYSWQLVNSPPQIQPIGNSYVQSAQGQPVAGGSGVQVFRFRASQPGSYRLTFELKRPWESQAQQSRAIQVQVQ
jgi:inhibitor of cysteine peptidase